MGKGMNPLPLPTLQTGRFQKSSMGFQPMSLPLTPVDRVKRIALTLPSHLRLVFYQPPVTDLKHRLSPFRRSEAAPRKARNFTEKSSFAA